METGERLIRQVEAALARDDEAEAVDVHKVVNGRDVGVVQGGERVRLAPHLILARTVFVGPQYFQRDIALEVFVVGAIDLPHPARPDRPQDFVRPPACTRCERRMDGGIMHGERDRP